MPKPDVEQGAADSEAVLASIEVLSDRRARRRNLIASGERVTRRTWTMAALQVLGEGGPSAVNIDGIASLVGRTKGSFYSHFDDRSDLIVSIAEAVLEIDDEARLSFAADSPTHAVTLLRELVDFSYVADSTAQRAFYFLTRMDNPPALAPVLAEIRRRRIETYRRLLEATGMAVDAGSRAVAMHAAFVGLHSLVMTNPEFAANDQYLAALKSTLIPQL